MATTENLPQQQSEAEEAAAAAATAALRSRLEASVSDRSFWLEATAPKPLNVTCYGSSSSKTPERYLREAQKVGYLLAKRGHTCINGAGSFGCMAAMNDGVQAGEGHVRGVIHEMFLADNGYFDVEASTQQKLKRMRRGSSHQVFDNAIILDREQQKEQQTKEEEQRKNNNNTKEPETTSNSSEENNTTTSKSPVREILVAGGPDLQERKKFLVANTDALIVLPGGPGTWDELWEMACARHLNLNQLPIVCVNTDGYYEPFREMLHRAYRDKLIHLPPHEIVRFASGAEDAVLFVEGALGDDASGQSFWKGWLPSQWGSLPTHAVAFVAGAVLGTAMVARSTGRSGRG